MIEPKVNSLQFLHDKAAKMQAYLVDTYDSQNPNDLIQRLEYLQILVAESGQLLAESKWYQDKIVNGAIVESLKQAYDKSLSPSTINKYVNTTARDYNYLVNVFDRINSTATHQIDALRSIISYRKAEMQL
jgi:hypothetical protein